MQKDVDEGRRRLNFSEWGRGEHGLEEIAESVQNKQMPPSYFLALHPDARLTAQEKGALIHGLIATTGAAGGEGGED